MRLVIGPNLILVALLEFAVLGSLSCSGGSEPETPNDDTGAAPGGGHGGSSLVRGEPPNDADHTPTLDVASGTDLFHLIDKGPPMACEPGTHYCSNNRAWRCREDGSGYDKFECSGGCENGECRP